MVPATEYLTPAWMGAIPAVYVVSLRAFGIKWTTHERVAHSFGPKPDNHS